MFDNEVTDEAEIIPTLAFAARAPEIPALADLREKFAEAAKGSEAWKELNERFFLNVFDTLEAQKGGW